MMALAHQNPNPSGIDPKEKGRAPEGCGQKEMKMLNVVERALGRNTEGRPETFSNTGEFVKKLRWCVENPDKEGVVWRITPAMATAMLEWNDRNRPVSNGTVKKYSALMRAGRWPYTGVPIVFSKTRLIDGQHRLLACVASSTSFDAMVAFGVPDESFAFIDVGKTRTASNVFAIHGVANHAVMAAAIQWIIGYEGGQITAASKAAMRVDHAALFEAYEKHAGLQDSAWVAHLFARARIISPSTMCALHYVCAKKNREVADAFFRKVGEGLGFTGKKDPAYRLHKELTDSAVAQRKVGRLTAAALTIKAWNATRLGRDVGVLHFGADEVFPKAI